MYYLESSQLRLAVHGPADGFYLGTRFDRSGVLDSLQLGGKEICGRWFEHYHPRMHDAVCGPAEEFTAIGYRPGGHFLKIGVGVLWANHRIACLEPYNFFSSTPESPFSWRVQYELFKNT